MWPPITSKTAIPRIPSSVAMRSRLMRGARGSSGAGRLQNKVEKFALLAGSGLGGEMVFEKSHDLRRVDVRLFLAGQHRTQKICNGAIGLRGRAAGENSERERMRRSCQGRALRREHQRRFRREE